MVIELWYSKDEKLAIFVLTSESHGWSLNTYCIAGYLCGVLIFAFFMRQNNLAKINSYISKNSEFEKGSRDRDKSKETSIASYSYPAGTS